LEAAKEAETGAVSQNEVSRYLRYPPQASLITSVGLAKSQKSLVFYRVLLDSLSVFPTTKLAIAVYSYNRHAEKYIYIYYLL
jgi:hypothetical protein